MLFLFQLIQRIIHCINMSGYSYYYEKLFVSGMSYIGLYKALTKLLLSMVSKLLLIGAQCSRHFFFL